MTIMTHEQRADRRQRMATEVKKGTDPRKVAQAQGVSIDLVRMACEEHGVPCYVELPVSRTGKTVDILAALRDAPQDQTLQEIADRLDISIQRVKQVAREGRIHGFLKRRKKT